MNILTVLLTAEEPLLLTSLQGDTNSSVSFDYIPGSVLRGALIEHYRRAGNATISNDPAFRALFLDGTVRYLNGYLAVPGASVGEHDVANQGELLLHRSLPIQRSWLKPKRGSTPVYDLSLGPQPPEDPIDQPKPLGGTSCDLNGSTVRLFKVAQHINIHNQRDRARGRGITNNATGAAPGAVFRYEAIAPGQTFQAVILLDDAADEHLPVLKTLLAEGVIWLGGSRHAGYGRTRVHGLRNHTAWREVSRAPLVAPTGELHVTLLSDLIARDVNGQYAGTFPAAALAAQLGVGLDLDVPRSFQAQTYHGGFNRTWSLPLPQVLGLRAGSVLVFTITGPLDATTLQRVEWAGLGERRAEGFGRIAFQWHPSQQRITISADEHTAQPLPDPLSGACSNTPAATTQDTHKDLKDFAYRLTRQRFDAQLVTLVEQYHINGGRISNAQLLRLRIVARRLLESNTMTDLHHRFLRHLPQRSQDQFRSANVGTTGQRLLPWLEQITTDPRTLWDAVQAIDIQGVEVPLDGLYREYSLRLIMALAKQATKNASKKSASSEETQ